MNSIPHTSPLFARPCAPASRSAHHTTTRHPSRRAKRRLTNHSTRRALLVSSLTPRLLRNRRSCAVGSGAAADLWQRRRRVRRAAGGLEDGRHGGHWPPRANHVRQHGTRHGPRTAWRDHKRVLHKQGARHNDVRQRRRRTCAVLHTYTHHTSRALSAHAAPRGQQGCKGAGAARGAVRQRERGCAQGAAAGRLLPRNPLARWRWRRSPFLGSQKCCRQRPARRTVAALARPPFAAPCHHLCAAQAGRHTDRHNTKRISPEAGRTTAATHRRLQHNATPTSCARRQASRNRPLIRPARRHGSLRPSPSASCRVALPRPRPWKTPLQVGGHTRSPNASRTG